MGRKILLVTTDQQRYDTLGCNGGTLSRTPVADGLAAGGNPLRAGPPPVGRVHAVALHHPHRPTPQHPRGVDERRAAARSRHPRSPRSSTTPGTARHWWARRTSSPSSTRSSGSRRTPSAAPAPSRPAASTAVSSISSSPPTDPSAPSTTPGGMAETPRGGRASTWPGRLLPGQCGRGRGHRRTPGQRQPHRAGHVPHRLGGRSDDRLA